MTWITQQGTLYEGDMQYGDREATSLEINAKQLQKELASLATEYKSDLSNYQISGYLSAIVADGPTEETKKAAFVQLIAARKTQYQADIVTTRTRYTPPVAPPVVTEPTPAAVEPTVV